ncbi:hypothetical protein AMJ74_00435 [candidate division WOR_3 bacterium SM1_77]|uniref:Phospholipase/carboxylesterase/thioesterase domain-containing protein n=1 Tax=candidate division WOR_3 bacterium SM1_77 TaxID=1703778 RepID=A0A0S8K1P3_UNCW3|nr:MAG: hypothetical protein AMJ74_00435 [candidate division WOR_3 bacterium SM1_77]
MKKRTSITALILTSLILITFSVFLRAQTQEQLSKLWEHIRTGETKGAITLSYEILQNEPENSYIMRLLAMAYARENEAESSLVWIENSIQYGNTDYLEFLRDEDFKTVHAHPRFKELMKLGKRLALEESKEKEIKLKAGEWTDVPLESKYELPTFNISLSFDHQNFYMKALVTDAHFKDGNRAWRYGDGFFINFVTPVSLDSVYSDRFYAYGFSRENGKPIAVLVNRDGTYYLGYVKDMTPKINIDSKNNQAEYLVTIPWSRLYPYHPLMDETAGINIIYTSQNDDGSRKRVKYVPDTHHDSESTNLRRYVPMYFEQSPKSALHVTGRLESRLLHSDNARIKLAVWAPEKRSVELLTTIHNEDDQKVWESALTKELSPARNIIQRDVEIPEEEGKYTVTVTLDGSERWKDIFYKYDRQALDRMKTGIQLLAEKEKDIVLSNSVDAMTYRFTELENGISGFTERDNPVMVKENIEELESLYGRCKKSGSIYVGSGYILSAFRSPRDSTLQPFSIHLPKKFDPSKSYDLLVALHGSGVDEVGFLRWTARNYQDTGFITIGPRGRDLSAWYLGPTEYDVADLVKITKKLFNIEKTLVFGFSMGGYGVWRMSFLHSDLFEAAICVSGRPYPFTGSPQEDDMRNHIGKGKNLTYLVIHGTDDRAVSIEATDEFITQLKEAGYKIEYIRVPGGGHGNFSVKKMVSKWLKKNFRD